VSEASATLGVEIPKRSSPEGAAKSSAAPSGLTSKLIVVTQG